MVEQHFVAGCHYYDDIARAYLPTLVTVPCAVLELWEIRTSYIKKASPLIKAEAQIFKPVESESLSDLMHCSLMHPTTINFFHINSYFSVKSVVVLIWFI